MHFKFLWCCRGGNKIFDLQLLKVLRLFPSPNLGWACGTVYHHSGAFWSTGSLGTALGIWKWRPKAPIRTLFGLVSFYSRRVLQSKMCHECIFLWHTCLSHKNVANRTFSTRVLQTVSLVSRLNSRLGALRYVTAMLLRRWAWLIGWWLRSRGRHFSNPQNTYVSWRLLPNPSNSQDTSGTFGHQDLVIVGKYIC